MEKHKSKHSPIKSPRLINEAHKREENIKDFFKKLIKIGMIGNSKFTGIILSGLFPEVVM